mgnify:CR=1 FL=1
MKLTLLILATILRSYFYFSALYLLGMFIVPIMMSGKYIMGSFALLLFPLVYLIGPFLMGGNNVMILTSSFAAFAISASIRSWVVHKYGSLESN